MRLKTALAFLFFGTMGFFSYDFARIHTSGDVLAYKQFARALMRGDRLAARRMVADPTVLEAFEHAEERQARYRGESRFTYHQILSQTFTPDGKQVTLRVKQITRMDPVQSEHTLFGSQTIEEVHRVVLKKDDRVWRIAHFQDPYFGT